MGFEIAVFVTFWLFYLDSLKDEKKSDGKVEVKPPV
jgi:hypothetical protein